MVKRSTYGNTILAEMDSNKNILLNLKELMKEDVHSSRNAPAGTAPTTTGPYQYDVGGVTRPTYGIGGKIQHLAKIYLNKKLTETTVGIDENKVFIVDAILDPVKKEIILPKIEYDFAKWNLRDKSISDLNSLAEALKDNPNVVIELKSHTDFIGNNRSNQRLSQKRADACVDYLVGIGIDPGQLVAVGAGENEPFVIGSIFPQIREYVQNNVEPLYICDDDGNCEKEYQTPEFSVLGKTGHAGGDFIFVPN